MYASPSTLPETDRGALVIELNQRLVDAIDLHTQVKVAHWNIRGPHFASLHPLFDTFATDLAVFIDAIGERAVTLGGHVQASARYVATASSLPDYDPDAVLDLDHARLLADRFDVFLAGLRRSRERAEGLRDVDTVDLLTGVVTTFEKHAWFLRSTLGR